MLRTVNRVKRYRGSPSTWRLGTHLALQWSSQYPVASHPATLSKSHVPTVYLTWVNSLFLSSLAFSRISKLRGISGAQNSDSPRLHHFPVHHPAINFVAGHAATKEQTLRGATESGAATRRSLECPRTLFSQSRSSWSFISPLHPTACTLHALRSNHLSARTVNS